MIALRIVFLVALVICVHCKHCTDVLTVCNNVDTGQCQCSTVSDFDGLRSKHNLECEAILTCRNITKEILHQLMNKMFNLQRHTTNDVNQDKLIFTKAQIVSSDLRELDKNDTKYFEKVTSLNFSHDKIHVISSDTFLNLSKLTNLDLSHNKLLNLPHGLFKDLDNIVNLNLSYNRIEKIEPRTFETLKTLKNLDLSQNNLKVLPKDLFFNTSSLRVLSLSHNNLYRLPIQIFKHVSLLEVLDLSYNMFTDLLQEWFQPLRNLRNISVAYNSLTTISEKTFEDNKQLCGMDLSGNPWICDENIYWLYHWMNRNEGIFENANSIFCNFSSEYVKFKKGLESVHMQKEVDKSDICKLCKCLVVAVRKLISVDCNNQNFTSVPQKLPYGTRILYLANNRITSIMINEKSSQYWKNITFLRLDNNLISSLNTLEGSALMENLVVLNITNNRLTEVPIHLLDQLKKNLNEIRLGGNPWKCDCNTVRFQAWLQNNYQIVKDIKSIHCDRNGGFTSNQIIQEMKKSELCPQEIETLNYLDILNIVMGILIVVIISKVTFDYWQQKRTGKLPRFFSLNLQ